MQPPKQIEQQYHIEPSGSGYRVIGAGLWVWEETLHEAQDWIRELESPMTRRQAPPSNEPDEEP